MKEHVTTEQLNMLEDSHRDAVIRFAHIDSAGIVFYPRYIEIVAAAFPELPFSSPPFEVDLVFYKPNRIGDELVLSAAETAGGSEWVVSGRTDGVEHFHLALRSTESGIAHQSGTSPRGRGFRMSFPALSHWAVDPNGKMHFSRYYEFISEAVESWFEQALGRPFKHLHRDHMFGVPTVSLSTVCHGLPALDDAFDISIHVDHIGNCSVKIISRIECSRTALALTRQTIVFVRTEGGSHRPAPIPGDIRERLCHALD